MATWLSHLRIAENLIKKYDLDDEAFIIGNIAPDSGVPNEDWSAFNPPKEVTHWIKYVNDIPTIMSEEFFNKYITLPDIKMDKERFSFLLGYYVHLLTDWEWDKRYKAKRKSDKDFDQRLNEDLNFIWEVKKDWYGLDFKYLRENKDSAFYHRFINIDKVKDYLEYFPNGAIERQVKYISSFYLENIQKEDEDRNFVYLTKAEMDVFMEEATKYIDNIIVEKL